MRWVCGTCVLIALFSPAACSPYPDDGSQFVCSGTCAPQKQDVAYWCARGPTQVIIDLAEPGRAFKTCMADHGYVENRTAKVGWPSIQAATAPLSDNNRRKRTQQTRRTVTARKAKRVVKHSKSTTGSQKQKVVAQKAKKFDPQDLFKNPSGGSSSNLDETSKIDREN